MGFGSKLASGDGKLEVGAGAGYLAGFESRSKFDITNGTFTSENESKVNGIFTSASVNTASMDAKLSWEFGGKIAVGLGLNGEIKLELNFTQLHRALQPLKIEYTSYEKQELGAGRNQK